MDKKNLTSWLQKLKRNREMLNFFQTRNEPSQDQARCFLSSAQYCPQLISLGTSHSNITVGWTNDFLFTDHLVVYVVVWCILTQFINSIKIRLLCQWKVTWPLDTDKMLGKMIFNPAKWCPIKRHTYLKIKQYYTYYRQFKLNISQRVAL